MTPKNNKKKSEDLPHKLQVPSSMEKTKKFLKRLELEHKVLKKIIDPASDLLKSGQETDGNSIDNSNE